MARLERVGKVARVEADAVILDAQFHIVSGLSEPDVDLAGSGVLCDVGEQFPGGPNEELAVELRAHRRNWRMRFLPSGEEALEALEAEPADVVISDLRMPGMDGATLLEAVRDRCPPAVRIVLSGHAEIKMVARAVGAAHRLIAKPCDTDELARVIERSCALQEMATRGRA